MDYSPDDSSCFLLTGSRQYPEDNRSEHRRSGRRPPPHKGSTKPTHHRNMADREDRRYEDEVRDDEDDDSGRRKGRHRSERPRGILEELIERERPKSMSPSIASSGHGSRHHTAGRRHHRSGGVKDRDHLNPDDLADEVKSRSSGSSSGTRSKDRKKKSSSSDHGAHHRNHDGDDLVPADDTKTGTGSSSSSNDGSRRSAKHHHKSSKDCNHHHHRGHHRGGHHRHHRGEPQGEDENRRKAKTGDHDDDDDDAAAAESNNIGDGLYDKPRIPAVPYHPGHVVGQRLTTAAAAAAAAAASDKDPDELVDDQYSRIDSRNRSSKRAPAISGGLYENFGYQRQQEQQELQPAAGGDQVDLLDRVESELVRDELNSNPLGLVAAAANLYDVPRSNPPRRVAEVPDEALYANAEAPLKADAVSGVKGDPDEPVDDANGSIDDEQQQIIPGSAGPVPGPTTVLKPPEIAPLLPLEYDVPKNRDSLSTIEEEHQDYDDVAAARALLAKHVRDQRDLVQLTGNKEENLYQNETVSGIIDDDNIYANEPEIVVGTSAGVKGSSRDSSIAGRTTLPPAAPPLSAATSGKTSSCSRSSGYHSSGSATTTPDELYANCPAISTSGTSGSSGIFLGDEDDGVVDDSSSTTGFSSGFVSSSSVPASSPPSSSMSLSSKRSGGGGGRKVGDDINGNKVKKSPAVELGVDIEADRKEFLREQERMKANEVEQEILKRRQHREDRPERPSGSSSSEASTNGNRNFWTNQLNKFLSATSSSGPRELPENSKPRGVLESSGHAVTCGLDIDEVDDDNDSFVTGRRSNTFDKSAIKPPETYFTTKATTNQKPSTLVSKAAKAITTVDHHQAEKDKGVEVKDKAASTLSSVVRQQKDRSVEVYNETVRQRASSSSKAFKAAEKSKVNKEPKISQDEVDSLTLKKRRLKFLSRRRSSSSSEGGPGGGGCGGGNKDMEDEDLPSVRKLRTRFEEGDAGTDSNDLDIIDHGLLQQQQRPKSAAALLAPPPKDAGPDDHDDDDDDDGVLEVVRKRPVSNISNQIQQQQLRWNNNKKSFNVMSSLTRRSAMMVSKSLTNVSKLEVATPRDGSAVESPRSDSKESILEEALADDTPLYDDKGHIRLSRSVLELSSQFEAHPEVSKFRLKANSGNKRVLMPLDEGFKSTTLSAATASKIEEKSESGNVHGGKARNSSVLTRMIRQHKEEEEEELGGNHEQEPIPGPCSQGRQLSHVGNNVVPFGVRLLSHKDRGTKYDWDPSVLVAQMYSVDAGTSNGRAADGTEGPDHQEGKRGYLERLPPGKKKSTIWNSWKRQFFVAKNGLLLIYDSAECRVLMDRIELCGGGRVDPMTAAAATAEASSSSSTMLGIQDRRGHYVVVKCESEAAAKDWGRALAWQVDQEASAMFVRPRPPSQVKVFTNVLVIDFGGSSVRAGMAATVPTLPALFFPAVMAVSGPAAAAGRDDGEDMEVERYFGLDAFAPEVLRSRGCQLRHPMMPAKTANKFSIDPVALQGIFEKIFKDLALDRPDEVEVQLCAPRPFGDAAKVTIARMLFEEFGVKAVNMAHQTAFAMYAYNSAKDSGVVVDLGERMDVVPIVDGYRVTSGVSRSAVGGGQELRARMQQFLLGRNYSLIAKDAAAAAAAAAATASKSSNNSNVDGYLIVRRAIEELAYVARNFDRELDRCRRDPDKVEKSFRVEGCPSLAASGYLVQLGSERFEACEGLFKPELWGLDQAGVHVLVHKAIRECGLDVRKEMAQSIYLAGGLTLIPGFRERLELEVERLNPSVKPRVHASPYRYHAAYIGACAHAITPTFGRSKISREEFLRSGGLCGQRLWTL